MFENRCELEWEEQPEYSGVEIKVNPLRIIERSLSLVDPSDHDSLPEESATAPLQHLCALEGAVHPGVLPLLSLVLPADFAVTSTFGTLWFFERRKLSLQAFCGV